MHLFNQLFGREEEGSTPTLCNASGHSQFPFAFDKTHAAQSSENPHVKLRKFFKFLEPLQLFEGEEYKQFMDPPSYTSSPSTMLDAQALKNLLWMGAPFQYPKIRAHSWRLMLQIAPFSKERHLPTLGKKRKQYHDLVLNHSGMQAEEQVHSCGRKRKC